MAGESPAVDKNYQCYDCDQAFHSLASLGDHSQNYLWHSLEICLLCRETILVFIQRFPSKVVRLHTCKKALVRYQNSDLHVLSSQISHILFWVNTPQHNSVILCDACDSKFPQTPLGLFEFLNHSNGTSHNVTSNCKKCTMSEFKLTCSNSECFIAHFCTKDSKSVLKEIPKNVEQQKHSHTK